MTLELREFVKLTVDAAAVTLVEAARRMDADDWRAFDAKVKTDCWENHRAAEGC